MCIFATIITSADHFHFSKSHILSYFKLHSVGCLTYVESLEEHVSGDIEAIHIRTIGGYVYVLYILSVFSEYIYMCFSIYTRGDTYKDYK